MLYEHIRLEDFAEGFGANVYADRDRLLSGAAAAEIRAALEAKLALCFPRLDLSPEEQVRFARSLGAIGNEEKGGILKVSQNPDVNPDANVADYQKSSLTWHFDGYFGGIPDYATILTARVLPETGGDTDIADTVSAFEALCDDEKSHFETLYAVHDVETAMRSVYPMPTYAQLQRWQMVGQRLFPLVWKNRAGRKSLLLGHSASHVYGLGLPQGRALLCRLTEWVTQPRFVYRHEWALGDLLLWDNAGTLHRANPYPETSRRLLDRTALLGDGGWEGRTSFALPAESAHVD